MITIIFNKNNNIDQQSNMIEKSPNALRKIDIQNQLKDSPYKLLKDSHKQLNQKAYNKDEKQILTLRQREQKQKIDKKLEFIRNKYCVQSKTERTSSKQMDKIDVYIPCDSIISLTIKQQNIQDSNPELSKREEKYKRNKIIQDNQLKENYLNKTRQSLTIKDSQITFQNQQPQRRIRLILNNNDKQNTLIQENKRQQMDISHNLNRQKIKFNNNESRISIKQFSNRILQIESRVKKSEQNRKMLSQNSLKSVSQTLLVQYKTPQYAQNKQCKKQLTNRKLNSYRLKNNNMSLAIFKQLQQQKRHYNKINKPQIQNLIYLLIDQIKLDQQLLNGRICFEANKDPCKWIKLKQILFLKQSKLKTYNDIKQIFRYEEGDYNPLYVVKPDLDLQTIVNKYLYAQQHWESKIYKKLNGNKLKEQGLKMQAIDLQLKGYLQIEDIIRYLNIQTGQFYKNKCFTSIFKRMTKKTTISFQDFISTFEN